jgi:hypothetical protein
MTRARTAAARDAAPASWGALGAARGSYSAPITPVDQNKQRGHQKTTLGGVISE